MGMGVWVSQEQISLGQQFGVDARNGSKDWWQFFVSHWDWVWHWQKWFWVGSDHMGFWVVDWNCSGVGNWVHSSVMWWVRIDGHWTSQGNLGRFCHYWAKGCGMVGSRVGWMMSHCGGGRVMHCGWVGSGVDHCCRWAVGGGVDQWGWGHNWNLGHWNLVFVGWNGFNYSLKREQELFKVLRCK